MESDLEVVYKTPAEGVSEILQYLESRECQPETLIADPYTAAQEATKNLFLIRIAVPADQAPQARDAMVEYDLNKANSIEQAARKLKSDFLWFVGILALIGVVIFCVFDDCGFALGLSFGIWLIVALVWSNRGRIKAALERKE